MKRMLRNAAFAVAGIVVSTLGAAAQRETQGPRRITAAEAKHIVAYYFKAQNRLVVYDEKMLAAMIEKRQCPFVWRAGERTAQVTVLVSTQGARRQDTFLNKARFTAGVTYAADRGTLEGTEPKIGDTLAIDNAMKVDVAERIGKCVEGGSSINGSKGLKDVARGYTYLAGDGDQSGTETFTEVLRIYEYGLKDCSRGYLGAGEVGGGSKFVLSAQAWPNP
jgi:hypothetical protein